MTELRGIVPVPWQIPPWIAVEVQVFTEWLEVEIEAHAEQRLPMLANISGWRNREVHEFVVSDEWREHYNRQVCEALYGNMPDYTEGCR